MSAEERSFDARYWDRVVWETHAGAPHRAWRVYMQHVYRRLIHQWLPPADAGRGLKTDLFEEAVTPHHLLPYLGAGSLGIDISPAVVHAAKSRLQANEEHALLVVGDLLRLPLRSGCVSRILSGSSLDHFADQGDIAVSLVELARVLTPGGILVITFDNPHNPVVWLRNRLPLRWLQRLGLVPYYTGATYSRAKAQTQLEALGLKVTHVSAVAHVPRAPAIGLVAITERVGWTWLEKLLTCLFDGFEVLGHLPIRYRTGYYFALRAEKRQGR